MDKADKQARYEAIEKGNLATELSIYSLKASWLRDPSWDIEKTEGFGEHWKELLAFRLEKEEEWAKRAAAIHAALGSLICPVVSTPDHPSYCKTEECAWWSNDYNKCGEILKDYLFGQDAAREDR